MVKKTVEGPEPKDEVRIPIYVRPQRRYSTEIKIKVAELAEKIGLFQVSLQTGIPEASVRRWKKDGPFGKGGSGRQPLFPNVENELVKVFRDARALGILMTNSCLISEARKIGERLKVKDFTGTLSWLEGFKKRNGICYRKRYKKDQCIKTQCTAVLTLASSMCWVPTDPEKPDKGYTHKLTPDQALYEIEPSIIVWKVNFGTSNFLLTLQIEIMKKQYHVSIQLIIKLSSSIFYH